MHEYMLTDDQGDDYSYAASDIALPVTVLRTGQPWGRDEDGE